MKRHLFLSFAFPLLLLSSVLMSGCTGSNNTVSLRDNLPAPGETGDGNNGNKPTTPTPSPTPENPTPTPSPTATPVPEKVARIVCESQSIHNMSFNSLRGDVVSSYTMPTLTLYVGNQSVLRSKSPVPLQSDGKQVLLLLRAQEGDFTPWKIYKTQADLLKSRADLQVISNYQRLSQNGDYAYTALKLESRLLAANLKRTSYIYPNDAGSYVLENLSGSQKELPFKAEQAFSPVFVGGDEYLRFDEVRPEGKVLTQKLYHLESKKSISLPAPVESKDFQLFSYVNAAKTTVYWIEGRPTGTWKLRALPLNNSSKPITLGTLPGESAHIILPMVITEVQDELLVAYNEEEIAQDPAAPAYVKTGVLHLVKANAKLGKLSTAKTVDYSEEIKDTPTTKPTLDQGILRSLFLEPISGKLYASIVSQGGLASFDLKHNTWETHAMKASAFSCLNPEWGIEVLHE